MKSIRLTWALLVGLGACVRPPERGIPRLEPGMTEDQIFDATYQPPTALLRQLYEDYQLLVVSFSEHDNERQYRAVSALLAEVGRDPRLRYIVLERFLENAPVLETTSVTALDELQLRDQVLRQFPDSERTQLGQWSLCGREWAFSWAEFMPRVRAINTDRPVANKLRVVSVEGVSASIRSGHGVISFERDSTTAVLFYGRVWRKLRRDPSAKAIVVYNIGHTIQGFTVTRGGRSVPPTFLDLFLHDHPEAKPQTAVAMIDGTNSGYEFKFTARQVARAPDRPFGVRTAPFRRVTTERGHSVLAAGSRSSLAGVTRAVRDGSGYRSTATLADMVDAVIRLPKSEQPALKEAKEYLPKICTS